MANVLPSVLPPRCDSFPLRRIVSHQCSSTGTAMASSLPHMAPPKSTNGGRNVSSLSFGNSRRSSAKSGCRLCRSRPPSAAVLLALVLPSLLMLLLGSIDSTAAMPNEWEEQRMCGRLLIQALKMVCNHQYAQPNRDNFYETTGVVLRVRRSPVPRSYVVKRQRQLLDDGTASAVASPGAIGRSRRGIIWECCTNKCSLNYIRNNYCAAPPPQGEQMEDGAAAAFQLEEDARRRRK